MDRTRILFIIWFAVLVTMWTNRPGPTVLTAEMQAAVTAAQPATGTLNLAPPIELANEQLKVSIENDGALTAAIVQRYGEEIITKKARPDEIIRYWTEKKVGGEPPMYSAGVHFGKPPLFVSDDRRNHLTTQYEKLPNGAKFTSVDAEGLVIPKGLSVERKWTIDEKRFLLDLEVTLKNTTGDILDLSKALPMHVYAGPLLPGDRMPSEVITHEGGKVLEPAMSATATEATTGVTWAGVRNNYFAVLLDHKKGPGRFIHQQISYTEKDGKQGVSPVVGFRMTVPFIKKGESISYQFKLFIGPKSEEDLGTEYIGAFDNWDGWIGLLAHIMFWVLQFFYKITTSYGFAILALTFCVKLILHPMSLSASENMQRMQAIQPRVQEIKERYKDNPEQMNVEMMKLWKDHDYKPWGGCLPMLLQMPIFIALYNCLQYAIELKGVPFWWMSDLSKPDTSTMLALVFALSVYVNGKLMAAKQSTTATAAPAGADQDMQIVMNRMMPIMMYGMFVMMPVPGGVMIYLATQSLLGIFETQYNQNRMKKKSPKRSKA